MRQKSQACQADGEPQASQTPYVPEQFFFYGSLTDQRQLQKVLKLRRRPSLTPARVKAYKVKLWGEYPALVDGADDSYVDGMAYVVETEKHLQKLKHYETEAYSVKDVQIEMGGETISGKTFVWGRDPSELTEGTWSLEEWKKGVEEEMVSYYRPGLMLF